MHGRTVGAGQEPPNASSHRHRHHTDPSGECAPRARPPGTRRHREQSGGAGAQAQYAGARGRDGGRSGTGRRWRGWCGGAWGQGVSEGGVALHGMAACLREGDGVAPLALLLRPPSPPLLQVRRRHARVSEERSGRKQHAVPGADDQIVDVKAAEAVVAREDSACAGGRRKLVVLAVHSRRGRRGRARVELHDAWVRREDAEEFRRSGSSQAGRAEGRARGLERGAWECAVTEVASYLAITHGLRRHGRSPVAREVAERVHAHVVPGGGSDGGGVTEPLLG